ncbi:phosphotransferase family protein [Rhodopseudomonas sp. B29]|uniref:phosphotransferase family protein n=1 Tax=Rhodopseudomonas sp. B29 TaxID=95607 RepID=UPI0003B3E268|nr:phosphotransferase family protein [Rhodopseudomonas sp. B29]
MAAADLAELLGQSVRAWCAGATGIRDLVQLSGGASQETLSFTIERAGGDLAAILRRSPPGYGSVSGRAAGLAAEAELMKLAGAAGVPSPPVLHVLTEQDGLGEGFFMQKVEGETIARKILRDDAFAAARPKLARQLGEIAARIHSVARDALPTLRMLSSTEEIDLLRTEVRNLGWPRPVFQLALRWLADNDPGPSSRITLVHGDYRNGNLIIGPNGVRAVLDWELAHLGDPMEDLGWVCVNSWRFGAIDKPAGGFGSREDMFAGYEAASGLTVDAGRVKFWEVMGTLRWGIMCCGMMQRFRQSPENSMERAMIGRRASETEIDLLRLLAPRG